MSGVEEGDPDDITKAEHETQSVSGDIHHTQESRLSVLALKHIVRLNQSDDNDAVGDVSVGAVLLRNVCKIKQSPPSKTRAHLEPCLQIDLSKEREGDAGVELAADEEIVDEVAGMSALGELTHLRVALLDVETVDVDIDGDDEGQDDVCVEELEVVVGDEGPDGKLGAVDDGTDGTSGQLNNGRGESCDGV